MRRTLLSLAAIASLMGSPDSARASTLEQSQNQTQIQSIDDHIQRFGNMDEAVNHMYFLMDRIVKDRAMGIRKEIRDKEPVPIPDHNKALNALKDRVERGEYQGSYSSSIPMETISFFPAQPTYGNPGSTFSRMNEHEYRMGGLVIPQDAGTRITITTADGINAEKLPAIGKEDRLSIRFRIKEGENLEGTGDVVEKEYGGFFDAQKSALIDAYVGDFLEIMNGKKGEYEVQILKSTRDRVGEDSLIAVIRADTAARHYELRGIIGLDSSTDHFSAADVVRYGSGQSGNFSGTSRIRVDDIQQNGWVVNGALKGLMKTVIPLATGEQLDGLLAQGSSLKSEDFLSFRGVSGKSIAKSGGYLFR